jgi:hypothetical protein
MEIFTTRNHLFLEDFFFTVTHLPSRIRGDMVRVGGVMEGCVALAVSDIRDGGSPEKRLIKTGKCCPYRETYILQLRGRPDLISNAYFNFEIRAVSLNIVK